MSGGIEETLPKPRSVSTISDIRRKKVRHFSVCILPTPSDIAPHLWVPFMACDVHGAGRERRQQRLPLPLAQVGGAGGPPIDAR